MAAFSPLLVCSVLLVFPYFSHSIPEPGKLTMVFDKDFEYRGFSKALYKDATISAKGKCQSKKDIMIKIHWKLKYTQCADQFIGNTDLDILWDENRQYELSGTDDVKCTQHISLTDGSDQLEYIEPTTENQNQSSTAKTLVSSSKPIITKKRQGNPHQGSSGSDAGNDIATVLPSATTKTTTKVKKKRKIRAVNSEDGQSSNDQGNAFAIHLLHGEQEIKQKNARPVTKAKTNAAKRTKTLKDTIKSLDPTTQEISTTIPATDHQVDSNPAKKKEGTNRIATARRDGIYLLIFTVETADGFTSLELEVSMESKSGYLSATDWPLLPFYGVMSLVYLFYGLVWLIVSACQWRDLLRIQFWIGGVIALGMLEKAVFYSEYNNINHTGVPTPSLVVFAEVVSVAKRTLARMLVIIVSMGFGIVKPRLGRSLHRVLGVGALYFVLAIIEGSMRSLSLKADPSKEQLIAGIPLAVLDAAICWWIFMSLVQTTRTLRIRRNVVKLSLYRHFTNTLIFAVLASVAYMIWSIKTHKFAQCLRDWSELWLDEAFWHFLFSIILLVIMVLWRPTANNQRYAFTPIVDFDDDEEDNVTLSEAFDGMKMRNTRTEVVVTSNDSKKKAEDDLKWVEENIPSSAADTVLPSVLDSDEELMTTKFEMSKMD